MDMYWKTKWCPWEKKIKKHENSRKEYNLYILYFLPYLCALRERESKLFNQEPVLPMSHCNIRFKHNRSLVPFSTFRSHGRAQLRLSGVDGVGVVVQLLHQTHSVDMSLERPAPASHFHNFTPKPVIEEELGSKCLDFLNSLRLKATETFLSLHSTPHPIITKVPFSSQIFPPSPNCVWNIGLSGLVGWIEKRKWMGRFG